MTLVLNEMRMRMAVRFVNAEWQERPVLMSDDRLMHVAQFRAKDMAENNYFSHVSRHGTWPNDMVRISGYVLPEKWPSDTNYVESIGKGFSEPEAFMEALFISDDHRPHATGNVPFFFEQIYFGVGYAIGHSGDGTEVPYYVLITAPPEPVVEPEDHNVFIPGVYKGRYRLVRVG